MSIFMPVNPADEGLSKKDRAEFIGYLRVCSDRQVEGVLEKETNAGRTGYSELASAEMQRRGLA